MSRLELYLLGTPIVRLGEQEVRFTLKRSFALLTYCALNQERHDRARLADLFWADNNNPATALNYALSRLKRDLIDVDDLFSFDDFFDSKYGSIEFKGREQDIENFCCDALELEYFTREGVMYQANLNELERVIRLYRGEFMGAFAINNVNADFENWVVQMQARLETCYIKLLQYLVRTYMQRGQWATAVAHLHSLLKFEHLWTEANIGLLLLCYALLNQRYQIEIVCQQYQEAIAHLPPSSKNLIKQLRRYLHDQIVGQTKSLQFMQTLLQKLPLQSTEFGHYLKVLLTTMDSTAVTTMQTSIAELLKRAEEEAKATGSKLVGTGHLFLALATADQGQLTAVSQQSPIDLQELASAVRHILQIESSISEQEMTQDMTLALANIMTQASTLDQQSNGTVTNYHIWRALLAQETGVLPQIFGRYGLNQSQLLNALANIRNRA